MAKIWTKVCGLHSFGQPCMYPDIYCYQMINYFLLPNPQNTIGVI